MLKDIKSTVKNSVIYGLANLSNKAAGFILMPIYTTYLSQFEYGGNAMLTMTWSLFIAIFGLGLYNGFFRWYWDKNYLNRQNSLFYTITITVTAIAALMIIISFPFIDRISLLLLDSKGYSYITYLMIISAGLEIILQIPTNLMRLQERSLLFAVSSIIRLVVFLVLSIYFLVFAGKKLDGIFEATIISQVIHILVIFRYIWNNIEIKFEARLIKDLFIFSLPLCISAVAGMTLNTIDRYALKYISGIKEVALYNAGFLISNLAFLFVVSVNIALWPMIFKKMNDPDNKRFYAKIMTYYSFSLMFIILCISFYSQELIKVVISKPLYWDSYKLIPILNLGVFFIMLKEVSFIGVQIAKKTKTIAVLIIIVSIINLGLDLLFIPFLKNYGAAIAYLLTQIIYFALIYTFSQKYYKISYEFKKIAKILIVAVSLYGIVFLFKDSNVFFRLFVKTFLIISYPVILYFMKFFEEAELNAIFNGWMKWKNPKNWRQNLKI